MTKEEKRINYNEWRKEWRAIQKAKYPGYSVYYLPEEHYVGMSESVTTRMTKHKHLGRIVEGMEILASFDSPIRAHLFETTLHLMGYRGFRA